jgi:hypothetical protein
MPIYTTQHGWVLETSTTGYALGLNQAGLLAHCYWGARLPNAEDYPSPPSPHDWAFNRPAQLTPEEYPGYEDIKFIDPCLRSLFRMGYGMLFFALNRSRWLKARRRNCAYICVMFITRSG